MDRRPSVLVYSEAFLDYLKAANSREKNSLTSQLFVDFSTTPDQIYDWYYAQDPIDEERHFRSIGIFDNQDRLIGDRFVAELEAENSKALTYESAATNLVARTVFPEYFLSAEPALVSIIRDIVSENPDFYSGKELPLTNIEILLHCFMRLNVDQCSVEELEAILHATDMLVHSASFNETTVEIARQKVAAGEEIDISEINILHPMHPSERQKMLNHLIMSFVGATAERADAIYEQTGSFEAARIRLLSVMRLGSYAFGPTPRGRPFEDSVKIFPALNEYIETARKYFTGPECLQRKFKGNPLVRGLLHEYMWLLDFSLLLHAEGNPSVHVAAASIAQNEPKVNFPVRRRGLDFFISVIGSRNGWESYGVQLKSRPSPRYDKDYHPAIRQVKEQNLQDINPYSLAAKLDKYSDFLAKSEQDKKYTHGSEPIRKFMLKSVLEEYRFIQDTPDYNFTPAAVKSFHEIKDIAAVVLGATYGYPMNRVQRRQYERAKRRKNK